MLLRAKGNRRNPLGMAVKGQNYVSRKLDVKKCRKRDMLPIKQVTVAQKKKGARGDDRSRGLRRGRGRSFVGGMNHLNMLITKENKVRKRRNKLDERAE